MNRQHPIYTEKKECQDCCRCVRNCPVKAIRIENGSAAVMSERCIACGNCVAVCPVKAKRVRDDVARVKQLLQSEPQVIVSLAPSYGAEFADIAPANLVEALLRLGFSAVSETALGAQQVSAAVAEELEDRTPRVLLSSACPVVVDLVSKYLPRYGHLVTNLASPLLAHCRLLRKLYGPDVRVVFIGPCIAKKCEADDSPELLAAAISFADLRNWFNRERIDPAQLTPSAGAVFLPERAQEGAMYPVDGGMVAGIKANCTVADAEFMALSGVENVSRALHELEHLALQRPLFLELLACSGGCVNGPQAADGGATILKRQNVLARSSYPIGEFPRQRVIDTAMDRRGEPVAQPQFSEIQIQHALELVGKHGLEDQLNCSGCGYVSCREFALALLEGKAEPTMCVSYMRKLAQKKANALIQSMPSGAVIVGRNLCIIECNRQFSEMMGAETLDAYDAKPGLEGAALDRIIPFMTTHFRHVLETGEDIVDWDLQFKGTFYQASIFTIEPHRIVGAVIRDITQPSVHKEQVIQKAQDVMRKQMAMVQQIAFLLGENAAESQISLNAIIESFTPPALDVEHEEK